MQLLLEQSVLLGIKWRSLWPASVIDEGFMAGKKGTWCLTHLSKWKYLLSSPSVCNWFLCTLCGVKHLFSSWPLIFSTNSYLKDILLNKDPVIKHFSAVGSVGIFMAGKKHQWHQMSTPISFAISLLIPMYFMWRQVYLFVSFVLKY